MSQRDRGDWIPWYCEDSPGWVELSFAARGVAEGIARKMGRHRSEIHLGSRGLRGLCKLLHGRWEEFEPAISELLATGPNGEPPRLLLSEDQRILIDPDHESRRRPTSTERVERHRSKSKPPPPPEDETHVTVSSVSSDPVTHVTGVSVSSPLLSSDLISSSGGEGAGGGAPPTEPQWWDSACGTVEMSTGESIDRKAAWLRYWGHRSTAGKRIAQPDAVYWLTTVDAREAKQDRRREQTQRENAQARARPPPGFADHQRSKVSDEDAKRFAKELAERVAARKAGGTR